MSKEACYKKGNVIGRYEIHGVLGEGGFGVVYLAYHRDRHEMCALKTFRDEFLADPIAREAFKKEALLWVNLEEHVHILAARWVDEVSGRLFVGMDYIAPDAQGRVNLRDHIAITSGPLDTNQTVGWAIQFCLGMEHARAHGLEYHRDIKPGNILIARDWTLKIADFGLATAVSKSWDKSRNRNDAIVAAVGDGASDFGFSVIQTGGRMRCGTPGYVAPEVYRFEGADVRSDIYGFGIVLWQMAAGSHVPPWAALPRGDRERYEREIYEQQMAERLPLVKGQLETVVTRCLRARPSDRYATFQELREALESIWELRTGTKFLVPKTEDHFPSILWNNKGISLSTLGRHEEAIECFNKALALNSQLVAETDIWLNKTNALRGRAILRRDEQSIWSNKSNALLALGRCEEGIDCCDKALTIDPRDAKAWSNKGNCLRALGRCQEAVSCFEKALEIDPTDARLWNNQGIALVELDRFEEALGCCDKALAIDPRDARAWTNKGYALSMLRRANEAVECHDKALAVDPLAATVWNNKGIALAKLGRYEEAVVCFDKALTIDTRYAMAWSNKGLALAGLGQHAEAIGYFDKAIAIDPHQAMTWNNKGTFLAALGRHEEAIDCYDKALAIAPQDFNAWRGKALSLRMLESKKT